MHEVLAVARHAAEALAAAAPGRRPKVGLVLGSGLGALADCAEEAVAIPTRSIPGHPRTTVAGHEGMIVLGRLGGVEVVVQKGRLHSYEGHAAPWLGLPVRIFGLMGCRLVVLTNAAGGIQREFRPGDLMLITDHINLLRRSPLEGANADELGPRFPDQSSVYPADLRNLLREAAQELGIELRSGIYAALPGPEYETPAEVRMLRILGADAVGMSTVPEATTAAHMGLPVLGISMIANAAAGLSPRPLAHEEVLAAAAAAGASLGRLLAHALPRLAAARP
jgi:inosine/guanosine/xanthosine phosphorylase family protein